VTVSCGHCVGERFGNGGGVGSWASEKAARYVSLKILTIVDKS
jgi:tRNA A37 threonylcarbamoyladenosine dehydratase